MSDDTMAQDGFEPRPEIETPAPEADPVEALTKENADLKDRLLRLAAEMENVRKRMVKEAEANAESDKKQREAIEAKNQAESLIHSTEKSLKDYGDKVGVDEKTAIETALTDLKGVLDGGDAEVIKEKTDRKAHV